MKIDKFITFLRESGAEILELTNEYEVIRFRTINGVSIVYKDKRGYFTYTGESQEAMEKFQKKSIWAIRGRKEKQYADVKKKLIKRDGTLCFFCGMDMVKKEITIEHLLPISDGGNNNIKNLCLACENCNKEVGNMAIVEKIYYREKTQERKNDNGKR